MKRVLFFGLIFFSNNAFALSLDEYLSQTKEQNFGYAASNQSILSADLLSKKSFLLTSPSLFVDATKGFQEQNKAVAFVKYRQLDTQNYSLGIEQNFSFGLNSKFYYNVNRSEYQGLTSTSIAPVNYETSPVVDLTMPLWQGALGAQIKANTNLTYYKNQAERFNAQMNSTSFLVDAERLYWQLVISKKIVEISNEALFQSEKILQLATRKAQMNLGEKSDVLQAKADVESKKLQLKQAKNDLKIVTRNFNQKRHSNSDVIDEKLDEINFDKLEKLSIKKDVQGIRADVKSAFSSSQAAVAAAKIEEENNKPKLDLSGHYAFNGLEHNRPNAIASSLDRNGEEGYVGIKFSMPLAIGLQSDIKKGAKFSASSARKNYAQKVFDQDNDWQNLLQNLQDYQENLQLSRKIEDLQKSKLENERNLLKQGRTSTYQILLFEQDYNRARIDTVKTAYQLLSLVAEKKLYGDQ